MKRIGIVGFGAAGLVSLKALSKIFQASNLDIIIDIYQKQHQPFDVSGYRLYTVNKEAL